MGEGFVVTEVRYDDVGACDIGHLCALVEEASELLGVDGLFGGDFYNLRGSVSHGIIFFSHGMHRICGIDASRAIRI